MKSRILNVSPRAYIRDLDSKNVLPPIIRTGYQNELGVVNTPFDDNNTLIFTSSYVLAPYMVLSSSANFLTGDIYLNASLKDKAAYIYAPVKSSKLPAFQENSNPAGYTLGEENIGFPASIVQGFDSPERDKIAVTIDLTPSTEKKITRVSRADSIAAGASGEFYDTTQTGFVYFNFNSRTWDNIGETDPVTGDDLNYTSIFTSSNGLITNNNLTMLAQFCSTPGVAQTQNALGLGGKPLSTQALYTRAYNRIGEPTSIFEAPYAPKYHAKQTQSIKLSNFIKHPIVADRFTVELPVTARRIQNSSSIRTVDAGFARDIDNYVVFLYLQNRSNVTFDSVHDVSSSHRSLIGKQSFCFYNKPTFNLGVADEIIHPNGFSGSFTMPATVAKNAGERQISTIDANIRMTFRPQTFNQYHGGQSRYGAYNTATSTNDCVMLRHFWRGGQIASGTSTSFQRFSATVGYNTLNRMERYRASQGDIDPDLVSNEPSTRALRTSFWTSNLSASLDTFWLPSVQIASIITNDVDTPVILFPEDELVIGIDAGVHPFINDQEANSPAPDSLLTGQDTSHADVTGSMLTIRQEPAKLIIYGTEMLGGRERLPVLNQHLGSAAVSEDIHYDNAIVDQVDISPRIVFSGSYFDNIIRRGSSYGIGSVVGSYTTFYSDWDLYSGYSGTKWLGSFQRNLHLSDPNTVFYDTLMPDPRSIVAGIASASFPLSGVFKGPGGDGVYGTNTILIAQDPQRDFAFLNLRQSSSLDPVFLRRSFTYETSTAQQKRTSYVNVVLGIPAIAPNTPNYQGTSGNYLLYYNSLHPIVGTFGSGVKEKNYKGAASLRYGLLNPRQKGTTYIFRRDRYGQLRDMLEQSRDTKAQYTINGKPSIISPITAIFVSASSDTPADPLRTQCSNVSAECTSSVPYMDAVVRNRGTSPPAAVLRIGPNNLLFGVTGSFSMQ
jgi:hypothetical protein